MCGEADYSVPYGGFTDERYSGYEKKDEQIPF